MKLKKYDPFTTAAKEVLTTPVQWYALIEDMKRYEEQIVIGNFDYILICDRILVIAQEHEQKLIEHFNK